MFSVTWRAMMWVLAICLASAGYSAAQQEYTPEVGQKGKDVVWVPSGLVLVNKMLDIAKLTPNDILYDLGSGDGRTVIAAAKRGARAYGIEYNADLVALSRRNAEKHGVAERASFEQGDIFQSDFSRATVVTLFLLPELNVKLRPIILDMKPGTRVASNSFHMGDWKPDQVARVKGDCDSWCIAYLWIVPAKVEGTWKTPRGELVLKQQYQLLSGTLQQGAHSAAISDGRVSGERVSFRFGAMRYNLRLSGEALEGNAVDARTNMPWRATRQP